jgi:protease-4
MTAEDGSVRRTSGHNRKAAWLTGGLLFLVASGLVGILSGDRGLSPGDPHLARIDLEGPILEADPIVKLLDQARETRAVKGVLLRVDSPGGGVGASQAIYEAVRRLAGDKPVAVSMGAMAASGGYMAALGGDRVFALDSTLTGSIGVIMMSSGIYPLLDKIGIEPRIIKSGELKDAGTPLREMTEADRAYLQSMVDELHGQFVELVAEERGLKPGKAAELASGRVYSGRQARQNGLVDALGDRHAAEEWLRQAAGVGAEAPLKQLRPPRDWWASMVPDSWVRWAQWLTAPEPRFFYGRYGGEPLLAAAPN